MLSQPILADHEISIRTENCIQINLSGQKMVSRHPGMSGRTHFCQDIFPPGYNFLPGSNFLPGNNFLPGYKFKLYPGIQAERPILGQDTYPGQDTIHRAD